MTSYKSITSLDGMPVMTSGGLLSMGSFLFRACVISANPGGGYRGLWLDVDWCSINSQGGVVGASAFVVACMDVAIGQPSLWVTDRDPLEWALLLHAWLPGDSWGWPSMNMARLFLSIWTTPWS